MVVKYRIYSNRNWKSLCNKDMKREKTKKAESNTQERIYVRKGGMRLFQIKERVKEEENKKTETEVE